MAEQNLQLLLRELKPVVQKGNFVFCTVDEIPQGLQAVATFVEPEGISMICRQCEADAHQLRYGPVMAMICLQVYSSLEAVGMTAAVSNVLSKAQIPANVVAAYHHDYVFVPQAKAERAIQLLGSIEQHL